MGKCDADFVLLYYLSYQQLWIIFRNRIDSMGIYYQLVHRPVLLDGLKYQETSIGTSYLMLQTINIKYFPISLICPNIIPILRYLCSDVKKLSLLYVFASISLIFFSPHDTYMSLMCILLEPQLRAVFLSISTNS